MSLKVKAKEAYMAPQNQFFFKGEDRTTCEPLNTSLVLDERNCKTVGIREYTHESQYGMLLDINSATKKPASSLLKEHLENLIEVNQSMLDKFHHAYTNLKLDNPSSLLNKPNQT